MIRTMSACCLTVYAKSPGFAIEGQSSPQELSARKRLMGIHRGRVRCGEAVGNETYRLIEMEKASAHCDSGKPPGWPCNANEASSKALVREMPDACSIASG